MPGLFRDDIDPHCIYCSHSADMFKSEVICRFHGIKGAGDSCKKFSYDPLKRVPPKPVAIKKGYTDEDFKL